MRALFKLVRNGNATQICIPRPILDALRWKAGDPMIVELTEDMTVQVRPPTPRDMRVPGPPMMLDRSLPEGGRS